MTHIDRAHGATMLGAASGADTLALGSLVPNAAIIEQAAHAAVEALRHDVLGANEAERGAALDHVIPSAAAESSGASHAVRDLALMPSAAVGGLQDMQQAMVDLAAGVLRANVNAVQDLLRLSSPAGLVELQQRFIGDYVNALMQGATALALSIRRVADVAQPGGR